MAAYNYQILNFNDFSGGMTDYYLPGPVNQGKIVKNLFVTTDKKLRLAPGSVIFDSVDFRLPSGNKKVNALINFNSNSELFGVSERHLYYRDPNWAELTGPTGNEVLGVGDEDQVVMQDQWNDHMFITNDQGSSVMKVFRDDSSVLQVRNAGLPKIPFEDNFVSGTLQTAANSLANDLKTKLVQHFDDYGVGAFVHETLDSGRNALNSTASATNLSTLINLTVALITAYKNHIADARKAHIPETSVVHHEMPTKGGINVDLKSETDPTTLVECVTLLKDIHQKLTWHFWAINTHATDIDSTLIGKYLPAALAIGEIVEEAPVITPNLDDLIFLTNTIKTYYSYHISWTIGGPNRDHVFGGDNLKQQIVVPDASDETSLINLIFHLRYQYNKHSKQAAYGDTQTFTFTSITAGAGRPNINGTSAQIPLGYYVHGPVYGSGGTWSEFTEVTTSTATDAGTDKNVLNAAGAPGLIYASYEMHIDNDPSPTTTQITDDTDIGYFLSEWNDLLKDLKDKFNSHMKQPIHGYMGATGNVLNSTDKVIFPDIDVGLVVYSFHYYYEYHIGSKLFQDAGPVFIASTIQTGLPIRDDLASINPIEISSIPVLVNGTTENWDVDNIKIKIFRTLLNGTVFYKVGEIYQDETYFADTLHDTDGPDAVSNNEYCYTTGGILSNDPPPKCSSFHIFNSFGWFGDIEDDGETLPNRLRQSKVSDIDSCPQTFYSDFKTPIVGISSTLSNLLVFTETEVYRIEGYFDDLGQGYLSQFCISFGIGCVGRNNIVKTPYGVFFAGTDGFYMTDGNTITNLSSHLNETYDGIVETEDQRKRIQGVFDALNSKIWWVVQKNSAGSGCDAIFVMHLGMAEGMGVFTEIEDTANIKPSCLSYFDNQIIRGDDRGYIFIHDSAYSTNPRVDTSVDADEWSTATIRYRFLSTAQNFGTSFVHKYVSQMSFVAKNEGNLSLTMSAINDDGRNTQSLSVVRFRGTPLGIIDEKRHFPARDLRCQYKQFQFENAYMLLDKSDLKYPAQRSATVAGVFTVTLPSGYAWTLSPEDHAIYFEDDSYEFGFTILSRDSSTQLTVADPDGDNPGAISSIKWTVWGYPKGEIFNLLEYSILFAPLGQTQKSYDTTTKDGMEGNE